MKNQKFFFGVVAVLIVLGVFFFFFFGGTSISFAKSVQVSRAEPDVVLVADSVSPVGLVEVSNTAGVGNEVVVGDNVSLQAVGGDRVAVNLQKIDLVQRIVVTDLRVERTVPLSV